MLNKNDFQKAIDLINNSNNILITTHTRPDGDACGSMAAIYNALTALGKNSEMLLLSDIPEWYAFLFDAPCKILGKDISLDQLKESSFDLVILLDVNSNSQLPKFDEYLNDKKSKVLVIDHHVTSDGLGDLELVDTSAAATGIIIFDLFKHAGWKITEKIARSLFVAITTDTGWLHFTNTDSRTLRTCAELIDAGVNPNKLYHDLYQNFSPQRFNLMTRMLSTLELHLDGRYAAQHLLQADFEQTGASFQDTENLIDECQRIGSIQAIALFVELPDGRIKCSLRSTGRIDVRKIAQQFGGGGHTTASGTHLPGPLQNAKQLIFEQIKKQFA